jgi:uncharacterized membrane protein
MKLTAVVGMARRTSAAKRSGRRRPDLRGAGLLFAGWAIASLAALGAIDMAPMRFLDLPLGAYLAAQGLFVAAVAIALALNDVE